MILVNYRKADFAPEIVSFLRRSKAGEALLWQPKFGKHKLKQEVRDMMISESRNIVRFYFKTMDTELDLEELIYVKLPYLESIFKGYVKKATYDYIEILIPTLIMAPELRKNPRNCFLPEDGKKIYMGYVTDVMALAVQSVGVICLDISQSGLAFMVSEKNKQHFRKDTIAYLEALSKEKMTPRIKCRVVYCKPMRTLIRDKIVKNYRVGVALEEPIPQSALENFLY